MIIQKELMKLLAPFIIILLRVSITSFGLRLISISQERQDVLLKQTAPEHLG